MSLRSVIASLIPEQTRKRLRGDYNSVTKRFITAPAELAAQRILSLFGVNYLRWYADRLDRMLKERSGKDLVGNVYFDSGHEDLAVLKIFGLKPHHALLTGGLEELVEELERVEIALLVVFAEREDLAESLQRTDHHRQGRRDHEGPQGGAPYDEELGGLHEHRHLTVLKQIAAENGAHHDHDSDDGEHTSSAPCITRIGFAGAESYRRTGEST